MMEWVTLLAGAGIALASAFLGIVSEAAKGWVARRNTITDKRTAFQHRTAVELQETLYELAKATGERLKIKLDAVRESGKWEPVSISPDIAKRTQEYRVRAFVLLERIERLDVRESVEQFLDAAEKTRGLKSLDEAEAALKTFADRQRKTNRLLGRLIRDTWSSSS